MTYTIDIQSSGYVVDQQRLTHAITTVLDQHEIDRSSSLTVVVHDNEAQQQLNLAHRQIDAPTDVLSFPSDPLPEAITDEPPYLGDLLIAYPYTAKVADQRQVSIDDVLCLLVIHGTLHLLGYDHLTDEEKAEMWAAQADALVAVGIAPRLVDVYGGDGDV
jgi:probable rRNA maturation factor